MIDQVTKALVSELNTFIKLKYELIEPKIVISNLVNQDGSIPPENNNRVICSLINIEQERVLSGGAFSTSGNSRKNPPINLDLFVMFSSNYSGENYPEGLKFLSLVVSFFQGKMVFTPQNTPMLPNNIQKITLDLFNVDLGNLSHLWGAIGAKYLPSVIYKVRMITFFEDRIIDETSSVGDLLTDSSAP